jgi:cellobiose dehydrogenase (acceptor)
VGSRTANHWVGTAKMGTDSGLSGGTSVVDTNTKVYGTDNVSLLLRLQPFI